MEQTGKSYNSHFATIREWAIEDSQKPKKTDSRHSAKNQRIFRGEQTPDDIDIAELQMKSLEKQLPSDKEVEAFRVSLQTDYPDFTPEQHECFVESFRNGTWRK